MFEPAGWLTFKPALIPYPANPVPTVGLIFRLSRGERPFECRREIGVPETLFERRCGAFGRAAVPIPGASRCR